MWLAGLASTYILRTLVAALSTASHVTVSEGPRTEISVTTLFQFIAFLLDHFHTLFAPIRKWQ